MIDDKSSPLTILTGEEVLVSTAVKIASLSENPLSLLFISIIDFFNGSIKYLGKGNVKHTIGEGFVLEGNYRNKPYRIIRKPLASNSLHVEYDYVHIKPYDCFVINTEDDCYFCYTSKKDVITKLGFATEEIYQYHLNKKNK